MKYSIIIPCYNEEMNIKNLVIKLENTYCKNPIEWILVENGSRDNTRAEMLKETNNKEDFKIVFIDENKGYGYGLQQGMKKATGDYVGWLHADMQVSPDYICNFIDVIESKTKDRFYFIKGKRQNRTIIEYFFTAGMTLFASILFKTYLYDIGAIPVLFDKELLNHLLYTPNDFTIETYIYLKAKQSGFKIERIPINLLARENGISSWDNGFLSKIKQSKKIINGLIFIKQNESKMKEDDLQ